MTTLPRRGAPEPAEPLVPEAPRSPVPLSGLVFPVRRPADEHDAPGGATPARETASAVIRREIRFAEKGANEQEGVEDKVAEAREISKSFRSEVVKAQQLLALAADDDPVRKELHGELKKIATWLRAWDGTEGRPGKIVPTANRLSVAEDVIAKSRRVAVIATAAAGLAPRPEKAVPTAKPVAVAGTPSKAKAGSSAAAQSRAPAKQSPAAKPAKPVVSPEERERIDAESARKQALHQAMIKRKGERKRALQGLSAAPDVKARFSELGDDEHEHAAWMKDVGAANAMLDNGVRSDLVLRVLEADVKHREQLESLPPGQVAGYLALVDARKVVDGKDREIGAALVGGEPIEGAPTQLQRYTTKHAVELMTALRVRGTTAIGDVQWLVQQKAVPEFDEICRAAMLEQNDLALVKGIVSDARFSMENRVKLCRNFDLAVVTNVLTWPHLDTAQIYEHVRLIVENPDHWGKPNQIIALRAVAHLNKKSAAADFDLLYQAHVPFRGQPEDRVNEACEAQTGLFVLTFGTDRFELHSHWYQVGTGEIFSMHVAHDTPRIKLVDPVFKALVAKAVELHNSCGIPKPRLSGREHRFKDWL